MGMGVGIGMDGNRGVIDGVELAVGSLGALHGGTDGVRGFLEMLRSFGVWFVNAVSDKDGSGSTAISFHNRRLDGSIQSVYDDIMSGQQIAHGTLDFVNVVCGRWSPQDSTSTDVNGRRMFAGNVTRNCQTPCSKMKYDKRRREKVLVENKKQCGGVEGFSR